MHIANIHEAKTHLSQLLERVAEGEEIWIAKAGKPIARLLAFEPSKKPRELGLLHDQIKIADDFDDLPTDLLAAFKGEA
jgi:prevent-host-death family protein